MTATAIRTPRFFRVLMSLSNGRSEWTTFDHCPRLGVCVRIPGTPRYGTPLAIHRIR